MALIKCSECGKEISDKAKACPNCGCPVKVEQKNNEIPNNKQKEKNAGFITFLNIIRYIIGIFFLFASLICLISSKGNILYTVGYLLWGISIIPFTYNLIWKNKNVEKNIRITIQIIAPLVALIVGGVLLGVGYTPTEKENNKDNSTQTKQENKMNKDTSAICFLYDRGAIISISKTILLNENNNKTSIDKRYNVYIPKTSSSAIALGEDEKGYLCDDETKETKNNINGKANCDYDDDTMNFIYEKKQSINNIINEYKSKEFNCVEYSNKEQENKKIVGNWCLSFDNNGNTNNYYFTFNENGTYTEKQVYGENGKYVKNYYGYYQFENNLISRVNFIKEIDFYASSYDEYFTYNENDDTLTDSNIRGEFPNKLSRCE